MKLSGLIILGVLPLTAVAMPIRSEMLKPRAYFMEADNGLLEALDLKVKTLNFSKADFELCGRSLVRQSQTLSFSCTLPIPVKARISKLQRLVSSSVREIQFGNTRREVKILVSDDARFLTLSTAFDTAGIDFELHKFNDDFFPVFAKVGHLVISEALIQPVRFEVFENRPDQPMNRVTPPRVTITSKAEKAPEVPFPTSQNKKKKISSVDFSN
jgi:hypothetical protein